MNFIKFIFFSECGVYGQLITTNVDNKLDRVYQLLHAEPEPAKFGNCIHSDRYLHSCTVAIRWS